jgi:hypothetical protein
METEIIIPVEPSDDPLSIYRAQVAAEKVAKPDVMSDKTAERLRQINYEDRVRKQDEEKFAYALTQVTPTAENLTKLIARCVGNSRPKDLTQLDRRTHKLLFWIQGRGYRLGYEIRLPGDITFLSELTSDEIVISDTAFFATWHVKKIVSPISDEPEARLCALKRKCLKAVKGKAAPVAGKSEYCSVPCRGRARVIAQNAAKTAASSLMAA